MLEALDAAPCDDARDKEGVKGIKRGLPLPVPLSNTLGVGLAFAEAILDFDETDGVSGTSLGRLFMDV